MASEKLAIILGKIYSIPTVALRYSIVQGSRQSYRHYYSGALRDFSVRALAGETIVIQEDGRQLRDFVNVHDVVDAHLVVLKNRKADYQVFNVGMGKAVRVIELARKVCKTVGIPFRPETSGLYRINSPRNSVMNIEKLKRLGWSPKRSLDDSIREYVKWVAGHPEAILFWKKIYKKMKKEKILKQ